MMYVPFHMLEEFARLQEIISHGTTGEVMLHQNRFIMGELCLDNDWDAYLATLERSGLPRLIEIWQYKYDQYRAMQG